MIWTFFYKPASFRGLFSSLEHQYYAFFKLKKQLKTVNVMVLVYSDIYYKILSF